MGLSKLKRRVGDVAATALWKSGLTHPARWAKDRLPVVTFHRVLPADALAESPYPRIAVTPEELAWFLECFSQHFRCVSLREALAAAPPNAGDLPPLAVTFDDGTLDNLEYAAPVLRRAGVSATFFIVAQNAQSGRLLWPERVVYGLPVLLRRAGGAGCANRLLVAHGLDGVAEGDPRHQAHALVERLKGIASDQVDAFVDALEAEVGPLHLAEWEGMMSFQQIRSLRDAGHEIGCHSLTHPIMTNCSDLRLKSECEDARRLLENEIGSGIDSFCYPNGDNDARVVQAVHDAGFKHAVTTAWGTNPSGADSLTLKRVEIQSHTSRSQNGSLSASRLAWRLSALHPGAHP